MNLNQLLAKYKQQLEESKKLTAGWTHTEPFAARQEGKEAQLEVIVADLEDLIKNQQEPDTTACAGLD